MHKDTIYLRNLMLTRFNWIEERVLERARAHGYAQVTPAMSRLFGYMAGHPAGLSELARRMGVTRQAVHKLANEAAQLGLVEFVPSPDDARVVRLRFTQAGWVMSAHAAQAFEEIEGGLAAQLGAHRLAQLKRLLALPWDEAEQRRAPRQPSLAVARAKRR